MAKDINWSRWIYTSVVKHFTDVALKAGIPLYLNRYDRDTDWAELRFGGPYITEPSKNVYFGTVNVDIMITCFVGTDQYAINRLTGIFQAYFIAICCYKYGDGDDDDHSYFATLKLPDSPINVTNYGLIYADQSSFALLLRAIMF
jgi:hypothetical protein